MGLTDAYGSTHCTNHPVCSCSESFPLLPPPWSCPSSPHALSPLVFVPPSGFIQRTASFLQRGSNSCALPWALLSLCLSPGDTCSFWVGKPLAKSCHVPRSFLWCLVDTGQQQPGGAVGVGQELGCGPKAAGLGVDTAINCVSKFTCRYVGSYLRREKRYRGDLRLNSTFLSEGHSSFKNSSRPSLLTETRGRMCMETSHVACLNRSSWFCSVLTGRS